MHSPWVCILRGLISTMWHFPQGTGSAWLPLSTCKLAVKEQEVGFSCHQPALVLFSCMLDCPPPSHLQAPTSYMLPAGVLYQPPPIPFLSHTWSLVHQLYGLVLLTDMASLADTQYFWLPGFFTENCKAVLIASHECWQVDYEIFHKCSTEHQEHSE